MTGHRNAATERRAGIWIAAASFMLWGLMPLYWHLLKGVPSLQIVAHRVVWSAVLVCAWLAWKQRGWLRQALSRPRAAWMLAASGLLIGFNWGLYIWAVNAGHVVESSLGYFINPLLNVVLGVLLGERLNRMQWTSVAIAAAGVLWLTVEYGRLPWISLVLACSFATYGVAKKKANVGAVQSLTIETAVLAPLALGYVVFLQTTGEGAFGQNGALHTALLIGGGVATALPLLCFGAAATRIPLSAIGMLQYLTPTLQFLIGVFLYGEPMTSARWVGYALVWSALVIFTYSTLRHRRRQLRTAAEAAAV